MEAFEHELLHLLLDRCPPLFFFQMVFFISRGYIANSLNCSFLYVLRASAPSEALAAPGLLPVALGCSFRFFVGTARKNGGQNTKKRDV